METIQNAPAQIKQKNAQTEGAWFIHAALQKYASEQPEAAANIYYQTAMQEALAGYSFAMGAE